MGTGNTSQAPGVKLIKPSGAARVAAQGPAAAGRELVPAGVSPCRSTEAEAGAAATRVRQSTHGTVSPGRTGAQGLRAMEKATSRPLPDAAHERARVGQRGQQPGNHLWQVWLQPRGAPLAHSAQGQDGRLAGTPVRVLRRS